MNRRDLLKGAGVAMIAGGTLTFPQSAAARTSGPKYHITLDAGGIVPFSIDPQAPRWIVSPSPLEMPDFVVQGLVAGTFELYNFNRIVDDLLHIEVLLKTGPNAPTEGEMVAPISIFNVEIQESKCKQITVDTTVRQHFAALGEIVSVEWASPFGDILGRTACFSGEFIGEPDGHTEGDFSFIGGFVVGSHSTWTPTAKGHYLASIR